MKLSMGKDIIYSLGHLFYLLSFFFTKYKILIWKMIQKYTPAIDLVDMVEQYVLYKYRGLEQ